MKGAPQNNGSIWVVEYRRYQNEPWTLDQSFEVRSSAVAHIADEEHLDERYEHRIVEYVRKEPAR